MTRVFAAWCQCRVPCNVRDLGWSEEQKTTWLPRMATGEAIGCFGLTEADFGSNPAGMRTRAKRDGDDWVINGTKMWITNGSVADVAIVWARPTMGSRAHCPDHTPGFSAPKITKKLSLRASVTSELVLENVHLSHDAVLPDATGLRGPLSCLNEARFGIVFGALGAARDCGATIDYAISHAVFDRPLASLQLTQAKLADMTLELQKGSCWRCISGGSRMIIDYSRSRSAWASSTTYRKRWPLLRNAGPFLAPAASPWSTRCCVTPTTWNRC